MNKALSEFGAALSLVNTVLGERRLLSALHAILLLERDGVTVYVAPFWYSGHLFWTSSRTGTHRQYPFQPWPCESDPFDIFYWRDRFYGAADHRAPVQLRHQLFAAVLVVLYF